VDLTLPCKGRQKEEAWAWEIIKRKNLQYSGASSAKEEMPWWPAKNATSNYVNHVAPR
jgi:hypothetical protein